MRIAILTSDTLPAFLAASHGPIEDYLDEDALLAEALSGLGATVESVPWRREGVGWQDYAAVVIRSTWDYIDDPNRFLEVLTDITRATRLVNPFETVAWNCDKRYLLDLRQRGAPVVPTRIVRGGEDLDRTTNDLGGASEGYIVKPAVGVGAFETVRVTDLAEAQATLAAKPPGRRYLLQPFVPAIRQEGEWAFIYLGGSLRYAVLKEAAEADFRVQEEYGGRWTVRTPSPDDVAAAETVMRALPVAAIYARVDMARLPGGSLALMELEAIEPSLAFHIAPEGARQLARLLVGGQAPGAGPA